MSANKVIVVVEGGVVQDVYTPDDLEWDVIDYDDLEEEGLAHADRVAKAMKILSEFGYGEPDPNEIVWACDECGSTKVQGHYWVDLNTQIPLDGSEGDDYFCDNCDCECSVSKVSIQEMLEHRKSEANS